MQRWKRMIKRKVILATAIALLKISGKGFRWKTRAAVNMSAGKAWQSEMRRSSAGC